jgi:hypothetical protein
MSAARKLRLIRRRSDAIHVAADCKEKVVADSMNSKEQFCNSTYAEQTHFAEHEVGLFIGAVTQRAVTQLLKRRLPTSAKCRNP